MGIAICTGISEDFYQEVERDLVGHLGVYGPTRPAGLNFGCLGGAVGLAE